MNRTAKLVHDYKEESNRIKMSKLTGEPKWERPQWKMLAKLFSQKIQLCKASSFIASPKCSLSRLLKMMTVVISIIIVIITIFIHKYIFRIVRMEIQWVSVCVCVFSFVFGFFLFSDVRSILFQISYSIFRLPLGILWHCIREAIHIKRCSMRYYRLSITSAKLKWALRQRWQWLPPKASTAAASEKKI